MAKPPSQQARVTRPSVGRRVARLIIDRQSIGRDAEERAVQLLRQAGCEIVARNYRCRSGEIDIIARRERMLIFAEVRLRSGLAFGGAAASITAAKRARIVRATRYWLARRPQLARLTVRFDALLMAGPAGAIEWIEDAFYA
jgi:putative endonuclease